MKIPLIKPFMTSEIKELVCEVLDSGILTEGHVTREFEQVFRKYIGCSHAVAITSCTTGLEMALRCLGIGPGDEVIVPDYTYPATAAVVSIVGATAVIVDIEPTTMLIDYNLIEKAITSHTKAIIPVSIFGNPLDYDELERIKVKYELYIIEDAACSIGAEWKKTKVGNQADISVFSFHPRKFITTGEGGMITTNNPSWADWMNSYKHFGMGCSDSRLSTKFEMTGTNYKLSNVLAAIGLGQFMKIDELLLNRRELALNYVELLRDVPSVSFPYVSDDSIHSYQSFCIFIENRDAVMSAMREKGIEVQIGTYALHKHNAFNNTPLTRIEGDMNHSDWVFNHCLTLPLYHGLSEELQRFVVNNLAELL
jgi:perosamine synthetase